MKLNVVRQRARDLLQAKHLVYSTEKAYLGWIERYAAWLRSNPDPGGPASFEAFLSNLNAATIEPHPGAADRLDGTGDSRRQVWRKVYTHADRKAKGQSMMLWRSRKKRPVVPNG